MPQAFLNTGHGMKTTGHLEALQSLTLRSSRGSLIYCAMLFTIGLPDMLAVLIALASASPMCGSCPRCRCTPKTKPINPTRLASTQMISVRAVSVVPTKTRATGEARSVRRASLITGDEPSGDTLGGMMHGHRQCQPRIPSSLSWCVEQLVF